MFRSFVTDTLKKSTLEGELRRQLVYAGHIQRATCLRDLIMSKQREMDYVNAVRDYIVEHFLFGDGGAFKEDTPFIEEGIIDSTGILELVMFLEETYGIKIEDSELVPQNFDSLANISQYLAGKTAAVG